MYGVSALDLAHAGSVVELGCGTGRLAAELLGGSLSSGARYLGVDSSRTMVDLARARVAPFADRAEIRSSEGDPHIAAPSSSCDRFVSCYVPDLLSSADIDAALAEAHRLLTPGGLLELVSLTRGKRGLSRAVTWVWKRVHGLRPALVGGCRPIVLRDLLAPTQWRLRDHDIVAPFAIASEVVVAERV